MKNWDFVTTVPLGNQTWFFYGSCFFHGSFFSLLKPHLETLFLIVYNSQEDISFSYITMFLFNTLFLPSAQTVETVKGWMTALWFTYFHICLQTPSHDAHRVTLPDQEQTQCLWMRWFPGTVLRKLIIKLLFSSTDPLHTLTGLGCHLLGRSFKYKFAVLN